MSAVRDIAVIRREIEAHLDGLQVRLTATKSRRRYRTAAARIDAVAAVGRDIEACSAMVDEMLGSAKEFER